MYIKEKPKFSNYHNVQKHIIKDICKKIIVNSEGYPSSLYLKLYYPNIDFNPIEKKKSQKNK